MNIAKDTTVNRRYYDSDKHTEEQAINLTWWIMYIGDEDEPYESEEDLWAKDKREARELAKAVLKQDFEERVSLTEVVMA